MTKPKIEVWLELETRCNLGCKFCYNYWKDGLSHAPRALGTAEMLSILETLFETVDCQKIAISGGEPLLREDLFEILSFIQAHGIPMVLASNAVLLTPCLIERLIATGIRTFQVPLHSATEAQHDFLSGMCCWKKTVSSLVMLRQAGASIATVFVATQRNLDELSAVLELCCLLDIRDVIVNRFVPGGLGLRNEHLIGVPAEADILQTVRSADARAGELGITLHLGVPVAGVSGAFKNVKVTSCPVREGQSKWTVDCEGNIRRCNHSAASIGNLTRGGAQALLADLNAAQLLSGRHSFQSCQYLCAHGH